MPHFPFIYLFPGSLLVGVVLAKPEPRRRLGVLTWNRPSYLATGRPLIWQAAGKMAFNESALTAHPRALTTLPDPSAAPISNTARQYSLEPRLGASARNRSSDVPVLARLRGCTHPAPQLQVRFDARDFVTRDAFQIAHCTACGFDITSPQPGADAIGAYYPSGYYGDAAERRFPWAIEVVQKALYAQRVRMVESVGGTGPGRVLDIGCGRGLLLSAFRRRGWETQGTELSEAAARYARQVAGMSVAIGRVEELGFPDNHFDAVTMWHVLEHIHDPRVVLAEANRILKPGGVLLVGVPNFSGFEARFFRDKWFHLDVPRHVTHLTKQTLKQALVENGFQDRRWSGFAPEYDAFSFVQSTLNKCRLRHNLLYNVLRGKQAKVIDGNPAPRWQVAASVLLGTALGVLSLPIIPLVGLLGQAGTMTVVAAKRDKV